MADGEREPVKPAAPKAKGDAQQEKKEPEKEEPKKKSKLDPEIVRQIEDSILD